MKKILLSIFTLAIVGFIGKVEAQCTVKNLTVELVSFNNTTCEAVFNVSFEQEINSGNKFAYIHLWADENYHTPSSEWPTTGNSIIYSGPSYYPKAAQLINALGTIAIEFNGTANPVIGSVYYPDNSVTPLTTGLSITKEILADGITERENISGLKLTIPNCSGLVGIKGDIWASQAQNGKNVHCAVQELSFVINDPVLTGQKTCTNPRMLNFGVYTNGDVPVSFKYRIYKDDGDGVYDGGDDEVTLEDDKDDVITITQSGFDGQVGRQAGFIGNATNGENFDYWIVVSQVGGTYSTAILLENPEGCIPLPVKLKSFTASRKQTNVELKWTTTMEQNNSGFELQRQSGAGGWQKIAFVNSKATGGNSTSDLQYSYTDINDSRGVSQYRLMQVDLDDNAKYSEIRSVQGIGQEARTIISPNPSANGRVNVTFQSANSKKDLQLTDMHGRMLKQWNAYSDNSLQITDLTPGIYQLRIVDRETGTQTVEKIMVVNR